MPVPGKNILPSVWAVHKGPRHRKIIADGLLKSLALGIKVGSRSRTVGHCMAVLVNHNVGILGIVNAPFSKVELRRVGSVVKGTEVCTVVGIYINGNGVGDHARVPEVCHALLPLVNVVEHVNHFKFRVAAAEEGSGSRQYGHGNSRRIKFLNHRCGVCQNEARSVPSKL